MYMYPQTPLKRECSRHLTSVFGLVWKRPDLKIEKKRIYPIFKQIFTKNKILDLLIIH